MATDRKKPRKWEQIARLYEMEELIQTRTRQISARMQKIDMRMMRVLLKSERLAALIDDADITKKDVFHELDHLENKMRKKFGHGPKIPEQKKGRAANGAPHASRGGLTGGKGEEEEEEEEVPALLIAKYRQLQVDMNLEVADQGTCLLQLDGIHTRILHLKDMGRGGDDDDDAAGRREDAGVQAFQNHHQLHRALDHMSGIAQKQKATIRRRLKYHQAVARTEWRMHHVMQEIRTLQAELLHTENTADALELSDNSGNLGGKMGLAKREVTLQSLKALPEMGLRNLFKRFALRVPDDGLQGYHRMLHVLASKMYDDEIETMRERAKQLRKTIGITGTTDAQDCHEFVLDNIDDNEDDDGGHPMFSAAKADSRKGLRGTFLVLHDELRKARREVAECRAIEHGCSLEWVTFHQNLRLHEAYSQRLEQRIAMEPAMREEMAETLELAEQTVVDCKETLDVLTRAAAVQAREIKMVQNEVAGYCGGLEYKVSSCHLQLQHISNMFADIQRQAALYQGMELKKVNECLREFVLKLIKPLAVRIQAVLQHTRKFKTFVDCGGDRSMEPPVLLEPPAHMKKIATDLLQVLKQEMGELIKAAQDPKESVAKLSQLSRSLHRLQHELGYQDFHSYCMRIASKATPPSELTPAAAPIRYILGTTPLAPKVKGLKTPRLAKLAYNKEKLAREKTEAAAASSAYLDPNGLTFRTFKETLSNLGIVPWKISTENLQQIFAEVVPPYAVLLKARAHRGIQAMDPFQEVDRVDLRSMYNSIFYSKARANRGIRVMEPFQTVDIYYCDVYIRITCIS